MEIHIVILLVAYLHTVSEMRSISGMRNWTIANQIFLVMSVKSVINIRFYKVPLNWSPNKICGKVFNGPWFSHFFTCLFSYLFLVLKRKMVTKLETSKESLQPKQTKTSIPVSKRKSFYLRSMERCSVENMFCGKKIKRKNLFSLKKYYSFTIIALSHKYISNFHHKF